MTNADGEEKTWRATVSSRREDEADKDERERFLIRGMKVQPSQHRTQYL
jgi:hypothetical protein